MGYSFFLFLTNNFKSLKILIKFPYIFSLSGGFMRNYNYSTSVFFLKSSLFILIFILLGSDGCDLLNPKEVTELDKIQSAVETFRADVSITLSEVAKIANLAIEEKSFVFVSPFSTFVSPIALVKGLDKLTSEDFAAGKNVMLTFFNLPKKSDIPSGFYSVNINKNSDSGSWYFSMKDMNNQKVFNSRSAFRQGQFNVLSNLANRCLCYQDNKLMVNYGFTTKNNSFLCLNLLSMMPLSDDTSTHGQKILKSLKLLREEIEPVLSSSTIEKLSKQVLIVTRDDKTAIVSAFEEPTINSDKSINTLYLFLNSRKFPAGFYYIAIKNLNEKFAGFLLNDRREVVSELNLNVNYNWTGNDIGLIGGLLENELHLSFIYQVSTEGKAVFDIVINE